MKFNKWILGLAAIGAMCLVSSVRAQTLIDPSLGGTNGAALASAASQFKGATNIVIIPFAKYDLTSKNVGYGVAALYRVTDNFWSGIRVDRINGLQTSAGVQAQLKADMSIFGIKAHPFGETSVGIGQDSLYGSVGAGAYVTLFNHEWPRTGQPPISLTFGLIGDYEHVVQAGTANDKSNQINAGPMFNVSF